MPYGRARVPVSHRRRVSSGAPAVGHLAVEPRVRMQPFRPLRYLTPVKTLKPKWHEARTAG